MTGDDTLQDLARRIGGVSAAWRAALAGDAGARLRTGPARDDLRAGIEAIYEGYALHYGTPRVVDAGISTSLRLLVGDWCYAAGLCDIAHTGDLDAVATLADLIGDVAALADEPGNGRTDATPDPRELRWDDALHQLQA